MFLEDIKRRTFLDFGRNALIGCLVFVLAGCGNPSENIPDTSAIEVKLDTRRFDKDLYAIDSNNIEAGLRSLAEQYPNFLNYFLDTVMAYGLYGNFSDTVPGIRDGFRPFLTYKDFVELEAEIQKKYPDTKSENEQLLRGFKLMKYYFPDYKVPRIIYLNMGLSNWASFPIDSNTLCIGLDMFLGDEFPHYDVIGVHDYMKPHIRRSFIPVSVFGAIYSGAFPFVTEEATLLDLMVQKGKEQYFLHKILPEVPDSVLFGFRQNQVEWCNNNEALIYNFFIAQNLLYNKSAKDIMPYITDGPFARGLEPVSKPDKTTPGNIGTWLGYKIVAAYMQQNPKVTLKELLRETDAPTILRKAKYKPR